MLTATPDPHHRENAFRGFDESVEGVLGADMRLIYGMAAPILMIVGLLVILALSPAVWLLATIMVLEFALLAVVVYGFAGLLSEGEDEDETP
jgi:hypothetical protein